MKYLSLLLIALITTTTMAQQSTQNTIDVSGEGIVNIIPDKVTINVRVENTGAEPKKVKEKNDLIVAEVFKALKEQGVADKHIQTDYIRLNKNYEYNTKTYNYAANQAISIHLQQINKYEAVMNALLQSGINRIDGVSFSSSNMEALEKEARIKAVQNAKEKAEDYASALSQKVGKAIQISEFQQHNGAQPVYKVMAMNSDMAEGGQTIAPGELAITVKVNVSFVLD